MTFRKKIYNDLEVLQTDLDDWLMYYNTERTHQGKMCCGPNADGSLGRRQANLEGEVYRLNLI